MSGQLWLLASIAARHLVGRRRQTLVAVSGVAVGVGFFLAVSAMMIGSQNDFIKTLIDAAPHIIISDELRSPPRNRASDYTKVRRLTYAIIRSATKCAG